MHREVVGIRSSEDVIRARQAASKVAVQLGFGAVDRTRIATAVSEIARNVLQHSGAAGELVLEELVVGVRRGLGVVVSDAGCGIANVESAARDGDSTSVISLGAGLPGSRRLMDEFVIESAVGRGTTVRMVKWLRARG